MILNIVLCLVGFALLYYGAAWLVKGAASLAAQLGISPLVIGLSVVAIGTSIPEVLVSIVAAFGGQSDMVLGNVVGSNICNMALGLGLAACFFPIAASRGIVRRDMPIMLAVFLISLIFLTRGTVGRFAGLVLVLLMAIYLLLYYRLTRKESRGYGEDENLQAVKSRVGQVLFILAGIVFLALGAKLVVAAASGLMLAFGASERFVGLTIVAIGTSLPELITSIVAAAKKESAISLGNIIGSNVFNLFGALGLAAIFAPITIPEGFFAKGGVWIDYTVMFVICGLACLIMWKTAAIGRKGGLTLLILYAIYVIWLLRTQLV